MGTAGGYRDGAIYGGGASSYDEDADDDAARHGDVGGYGDAGGYGDGTDHSGAGGYGDGTDHSDAGGYGDGTDRSNAGGYGDAGGYGGSAAYGRRAGHGGTTYGSPGKADSGPGGPGYGDGADYDDAGRYGEPSAGGRRRADITAIDLGYTGRRARPDNRDNSGEFDYGPDADAGYPGYSWEEPDHDPESKSRRKPRR